MQDNLGLLFTVGMIALFFLMDALARRRQQRRRDEVDEPESPRVREPAVGSAEPSEPVAWEAKSDWADLRRCRSPSPRGRVGPDARARGGGDPRTGAPRPPWRSRNRPTLGGCAAGRCGPAWRTLKAGAHAPGHPAAGNPPRRLHAPP